MSNWGCASNSARGRVTGDETRGAANGHCSGPYRSVKDFSFNLKALRGDWSILSRWLTWINQSKSAHWGLLHSALLTPKSFPLNLQSQQNQKTLASTSLPSWCFLVGGFLIPVDLPVSLLRSLPSVWRCLSSGEFHIQRRPLRLHGPVLVLDLLFFQPNIESMMGKACSDVCHNYVPRKQSPSKDTLQKASYQSCPAAPGHSPLLFLFDWNCGSWEEIPQAHFYITALFWLGIALRIPCCLPSLRL